jgi:4-amino-4-deoxy-L-arabinose transferase-like glycosyltransferase
MQHKRAGMLWETHPITRRRRQRGLLSAAVHRRRAIVAAVVVIVAIGVVLRFVTRSDLWLDEALTVNIARLPFGHIAPWLKHDGAPPLFYWMLHGWTALFGSGDVATRSLSGVISLLAFPLAWWGGQRAGGRRTAWIAVVVLALNPFAIRYATEARMYALEITVVFAGILAVRRAVERPSFLRLALVALAAAALAWSHYWALGLLGATVVVLALVAWRSDDPVLRRSAALTAGAVVLGTASLIAWVPTMLYQKHHTGTPWATPQLPPGPIVQSFGEFSGGEHPEGFLLEYVALVLVVLGAFAVMARGFVVELDARARTSLRWEAVVGALGLVASATIAWLGHSGFQPRYAAIVFPFFVLLLARGISLLDAPALRYGALAVVVVAGLAGGLRNAIENRTQTGQVARAIRAAAKPGDVVVYCPDQLGPATHRLLGRSDLVEVKYPLDPKADPRVTLVDWVDYRARLDANPPDVAARRALARAGAHTIFVVSSPGYITHDVLCPVFIQDLVALGHRRGQVLVAPDGTIYEHAGVERLDR